MSISVNKYAYLMSIQLSFIVADVVLNLLSDAIRTENVLLLLIHIVQNILLVFSLIVMFLNFVNTYAFKAGMLSALISRFKWPLAVNGTYLALSIALHSWTLNIQWEDQHTPTWTPALASLHIVHRTVAVVHYYLYKRSIMELSGGHYYQDSPWMYQYTAKEPQTKSAVPKIPLQ